MDIVELRKELDAKIPRDCVAQREGGNGKFLSYLEGHYVIDRLNKVVGQGNWAYDTLEMRHVHSGTGADRYGKPVHTSHYVAKIKLVVKIGDSATEFSDYGYGDGSDKINPGKTHELAVKEAVTDGLKRCAKNLGMSFGLALYDKSQENVEDEKEKPTPQKKANPVRPAVVETIAKITSRDKVNTLLSETSLVVIAKKKMTKQAIIEKLGTYGVERKEDLTDAQAEEMLTFLKGLL